MTSASTTSTPAQGDANTSPPNVFVGRQPILDREKNVFAYELLFRDRADQNFFAGSNGDLATCQTINNTLNVMGLTSLVGPHKAFINVTREALLRDLFTMLPQDRVVIEVLEDIDPDAEVIAACHRLKHAGYLMALDDFVMRPGYEPLVEMADFIKVDFLSLNKPQRIAAAEQFGATSARLLAEKVESHDDFNQALELGYSYFQGYFFCKPTVVAGRQIPAFKRNYIRFLQELAKPDLDFAALEIIIKEEPSLSVKLLHYLGSAFVGVRTKITSIRQALVLLGERPLRQWAALVALTSLGEDKPDELISLCLVRARFCELLATRVGCAGREMDMFLLGLLSGMDALLDRSLSDLLSEMPVAKDVKAALTGSRTMMAWVYALAIACERGNRTVASMMGQRLGLSDEEIATVQCEAMLWSDQVLHA